MTKKKKTKQLTSHQISYLRGLGHHLKPVAMVGKEGLSDSVLASVNQVLLAHELIKIKVQDNSPLDRKEAATELAGLTGSFLVHVLGKTALLYRENPDRAIDKKIRFS
ncbi:MAG: YhbY family RNA-binding protein [Thermodesulfobacteriota bacterium]|nr:YhbY family RNA-binding protein [Thermodesulfobacteriota bacterium]